VSTTQLYIEHYYGYDKFEFNDVSLYKENDSCGRSVSGQPVSQTTLHDIFFDVLAIKVIYFTFNTTINRLFFSKKIIFIKFLVGTNI